MKKFLSLFLALILCLSVFAACTTEEQGSTDAETEASGETEGVDSSLVESAIAYINMLYKSSASSTAYDYTVVRYVTIDSTQFEIDWSISVTSGDSEAVAIGDKDSTYVHITVSDSPAEDTEYTLTATVTDGTNTDSASFTHTIPGSVDQGEIILEAYALGAGESMDGEVQLTGVVGTIDTVYSSDYSNITVTILCDGYEDYPIMCYRLTGEDLDEVAALAPGDTISVRGTLTNYNGTIEFSAGALLISRVAGEGSSVDNTDATEPEETESNAGDTTEPESSEGTYTLATSLSDGDQVVIYSTAGYALQSATMSRDYWIAATKETVSNGSMTPSSSCTIWTVTVNADGSYTFTSGSYVLCAYVSGDYLDLSITEVSGADKTWQITSTGSGTFVVSSTSVSNSYGPAYLEFSASYSEFVVYASSNPVDNDPYYYGIQFYVAN